MSDWYYAAGDEQKGPINEAELKEHIAANKLPADTLVWKDGMDGWAPANQVPAFSFRQPPIPAKVQPAAAAAAAPTATATSTANNPDSTKPVDLTDIKGLMGTPEALEVTAEDAESNKVMGILAYFGLLCLVPIFVAKESPFAKYHANQGLVLLIAWVALAVVLEIINFFFVFLPGSLYFVYTILSLVHIVPLGLAIYGIINAAAGKCVPLPIIGGIKLLK